MLDGTHAFQPVIHFLHVSPCERNPILKTAVVIPCYRVKKKILSVLERIVPEVTRIYVVDDCCPENTGDFVSTQCSDPRVVVLKHSENQGVGGAMVTGYKKALEDGFDIVVKLDGDGQMDPLLIPKFIKPIVDCKADYTKGSRFYSLEDLGGMPKMRLLGNSLLSFVNKASSGYWNIMDPTNGYTAIHKVALERLPLRKLSRRYFFESDILFRLGTVRAVVCDIPMNAIYDDEESSLSIRKVALEFPPLYLKSFVKRLFYSYFLRDFNGASLELVVGTILLVFGSSWGAYHWFLSIVNNIAATTGTVMIGALTVILGAQLLLSSITFDMSNMPTRPLQEDE